MLVLTRRINERIMIGDDIVITIVNMNCGVVRLGIEAPKDVDIMRGELYDQGVRTTHKRLEEQDHG